jgi:cystathionine beta-synthase
MVCGVGSAGTITGLSRFFAKEAPEVEMVLADPEGSILAHYVETGEISKDVGSWLVEGIGEDFLPDIADFSRVKKAYSVSDEEAFKVARELLSKEGILAGSSSGTLIAAALKYCREQSEPKRVVTFVCDSGNKYLSKMYNDYWMLDQGFLKRPKTGDLRDLISRLHTDSATVTLGPNDTLLTAYGRMKLYDVSQLPVLEDSGQVCGILDEEDLLMRVFRDEARFKDPVHQAMTSQLETIQVDRPIEDLLPIFDQGRVAIVVEGTTFLGLITRIDLLNHLRQKVR